MDNLLDSLQKAVFRVLGLAPDTTVQIDKLAFYRVRISRVYADGRVDIIPDDRRLPTMSGINVRAGTPGLSAISQVDGYALLGWIEGDPSRPYVHSWEDGIPAKIVQRGEEIYLGDEQNYKRIATAEDVDGVLQQIKTILSSHTHTVTAGIAIASTNAVITVDDVGSDNVFVRAL